MKNVSLFHRAFYVLLVTSLLLPNSAVLFAQTTTPPSLGTSTPTGPPNSLTPVAVPPGTSGEENVATPPSSESGESGGGESLLGGEIQFPSYMSDVSARSYNLKTGITGDFNYEISLKVPPGRNGLQPDLKLSYSSIPGDQISPFGYGWSLNIPYIEKQNKHGLEDFYRSWEDYYTSSLDGELASSTISSTVYGAKIENGDFRKYERVGTYWRMTDKNGLVFKFGEATSTRQTNPNNTASTSRWMLEEIRDPNNNYITYEYFKDAGQIYPRKIYYTSNGATTTGLFEIEFMRESRNDVATSSIYGFPVVSKYRISEIQAKVSGSWVKKYELDYTTGDNGYRSLLSMITETGKDDAGATLSLPATTFTYSTSTNGHWLDNPNSNIPEAFNGIASQFGDVNGDGLIDIVRGVSGNQLTYFNTGSSTWVSNGSYIPPVMGSEFSDMGIRIVDVNGDFLADIMEGYDTENEATRVRRTWLNNGNGGWALEGHSYGSNYYSNLSNHDMGTRMGDVNGDGLADMLTASLAGSGNKTVYTNNGVILEEMFFYTLPMHFATSDGKETGVRIIDVNGDGLDDVIRSITGGNEVMINNGDGTWPQDFHYSIPQAFVGTVNQDLGVRLVDLNGDGLIDILRSYRVSGGPILNNYYLNKGDGTGWVETFDYDIGGPLSEDGQGSLNRLFDATGDGMFDVVRSGGGIDIVYESLGKKSDILTNVTTSDGGEIKVGYKNAVQYQSGVQRLNPKLPINFNTVHTVTRDDGFGTIGTTTYEYGGGYFNFDATKPYDRKFAGYATTTEIDPLGNITKTYFHQGTTTGLSSLGKYSDDISKIGKPYRVEKYDANGNLFQKTINKWENVDLGNDRDFVKLTQSVDFAYDGDGDHKEKAEQYTYYDTNGNLSTKVEWGEVTGSNDGTFVDAGSDKFTSTISYAASSTSIFSVPSREIVVNSASTTAKDTRFYYDSLSIGNATKGNETKREFWITGATFASTTKAHNSFGLVTNESDPRSKTTTYSYEANNLYVSTSTNPKSQKIGYVYDYSNGKPKRVINQNGHYFDTTFDALDRVTEEKQPDLTMPSTLVTRATYAYTDTVGSRKILETKHLGSATSTEKYIYFDGFNRVIQERTEAEDANTYSVKDLQYNKIGKISSESLPYFATGSSRSAATSTTSLFTNYSYDALNRVTTVATVVGNTVNSYDDWKQTVTDPLSNVKHFYRDAYGNLNKVEEVNDVSTYTTTYEYNYLKNLTKITDAASNIRNFTFDGLGRRLTAQDLHASGDGTYGTWTYTYDVAGNITSRLDPKSQTVNYTYDDINRVLTEDYTGAGGTEVTFSYDTCTFGIGKLCGATTTAAGMNYSYNPIGGISKEIKKISGSTYNTSYSYDRLGNITHLTYTDNTVVTYSHNSAGLIETVGKKEGGSSNASSLITDTDYGPTGAVTYRNFGNNSETTYTYDQNELYRLRRILTTVATSSGEILLAMGGGGDGPELFLAQNVIEAEIVGEQDEVSSSTLEELIDETILENPEVITKPATTTLQESITIENPIEATSTPEGTPDETISPEVTEEIPDSQIIESEVAEISEEPAAEGFERVSEKGDILVTVGDKEASKFIPKIKFEKWDEVSVEITPEGLSQEGNLELVDDKIVWNEKNKKVRFYELPVSEELPEGGYEIDVIYEEKPSTNIVSFDIDSTNLDFFYQAPLDQENRDGLNCTDTECVDAENNVIVERPENVIGSYAVYYKERKAGDYTELGGKNYGVGKAFHIYRPKIKDSSGKNVWGSLDIDQDEGKLTVTIPQDFLDSAIYPITVDPTLGYSTCGASNEVIANGTSDQSVRLGSVATSTEAGTVSKISACIKKDSTTDTVDITTFLNQEDSVSYRSHGQIVKVERLDVSITTVATWFDFTASGESLAANTPYVISIVGDGNDIASSAIAVRIMSDSLGPRNVYQESLTGASSYTSLRDESPWNAGAIGACCDTISVYATYTATSPGGGSSNVYQDINYTYDAIGNISQLLDRSGTGAAKTIIFGYDDLYRMVSASTTSASSTPFLRTYGYHSTGNIASSSELGLYAYSGSGHYNPHAASAIGNKTVAYDNNGNMTTYATTSSYTWDYQNRITQAGTGLATSTYGYDYANTRVSETISGVVTKYASRLYSVTGATTTKQIFAGNDLIATVVSNGATSTYIVHQDHLGSTNVVSNSSGNLSQLADYYPYGGLRINSRTGVDEKRKFIGEEYDQNVDLTYLNARYYNQNPGKFLSQDPVFWELNQNIENPQSLNSYSYAENNPIIKSDPTGRCPICATALIGAGGGIAGQFGYDIYSNVQTGGFRNAFSNFSSGETYLTRAVQGAAIGITGGLGGGFGIAAQAGIVGTASGLSGILGNAYLNQPITAQSVVTDTLIGGLTFGALKSIPLVTGRLPNFGTNAFLAGRHAQQSALNLAIESSSSYLSSVIGNSSLRPVGPILTSPQSSALAGLSSSFTPTNQAQADALKFVFSAFSGSTNSTK